MDESQATFNETDRWAERWILSNLEVPVAKRRQQGGVNVMIRVGIVIWTISGPFKVDEAVKLNSANYWDFMDKTFFACYTSRSFKVKCVLMHDNAPSHISKFTHEFFEHKRFTIEKIMEWPPSHPDLNLIENSCSFVKMKLYEHCKQYNIKAELWEAIKTTLLEIEPAEVKKNYQNEWIVDYELLLRRVIVWNCKVFKDYHMCLLFVLF